HCPPPHLHSFPTRRSSDLLKCMLEFGDGLLVSPLEVIRLPLEIQDPRLLARWHVRRVLHEGSNDAACQFVLPRAKVLCHQDLDQDRKSTRLNSSHVSISYA